MVFDPNNPAGNMIPDGLDPYNQPAPIPPPSVPNQITQTPLGQTGQPILPNDPFTGASGNASLLGKDPFTGAPATTATAPQNQASNKNAMGKGISSGFQGASQSMAQAQSSENEIYNQIFGSTSQIISSMSKPTIQAPQSNNAQGITLGNSQSPLNTPIVQPPPLVSDRILKKNIKPAVSDVRNFLNALYRNK